MNLILSDQFSINSNLAISKNKVQDLTINRDGESRNLGDTNIAFSPNVITTNSIQFNPNDNLRVSLIGKFVGDQYMSNTDTEASRLDDYFVTDLNFSYSLPVNSIFKKIIFSGMINNIFDLAASVYVNPDTVIKFNSYEWNIQGLIIDGVKQIPSYRACLSEKQFKILNEYAYKTYAPATDESRLSGAGAGLSDND